MTSKYKGIFSKVKDLTVTVVGDIMLDRYIVGDATRLSPEGPVPIVLVESERDVLGGAGNVVANLRGLGVNVNFVGVVGKDRNGKKIEELLNSLGCTTENLICLEKFQTITKTRVLVQKHQIVRFDHEKIKPYDDKPSILDYTKDAVNESQMIIISDYQKGTISQSELLSIIKYGNVMGIPILVDPKFREFKFYENCSCITPNLNELNHAIRKLQISNVEINEAALALKKKYNFEQMLITKGPDGMTLVKKKGDMVHVPTYAKEVFDVTGAGDTVISTVAVCVALGIEYELAVQVANIAASIVISQTGTTPIRLGQLTQKLKTYYAM